MEVFEKNLMDQIYENENSYLLNSDVPNDYLRLQVEAKDFAGAIKTKKRFIDFMRGIGTTDHQIRRAWLEIICLQILLEDFYRLDDSMQSFANEPGHRNMFMQDEFTVAGDLKDAVSAKDFPKLVQILKKPIFGFIEIEIVKLFKRWAQNPPAHVLQMVPITEGGIAGDRENENPPITKE